MTNERGLLAICVARRAISTIPGWAQPVTRIGPSFPVMIRACSLIVVPNSPVERKPGENSIGYVTRIDFACAVTTFLLKVCDNELG